MQRILHMPPILDSLCSLASFSEPPLSKIDLISLAVDLKTSFRIVFIDLVLLLLCDSGYADIGTSPCFLIRLVAMFHCPPSPIGSLSRKWMVRSSTGLSDVSRMASRK